MGLDTVELIVKIEQHFAISIPNIDAEKIHTVQDLCDTVARIGGLPVAAIMHDVIAIVSDQAGIPEHAILPSHSLTSDLGLD
jgi:acyl carrier protein